MRFVETELSGCLVVETEPHFDERGSFSRVVCTKEFSDAGIRESFVQSSVSRNARAGTLRGLHFQMPPSREGKLVRCTRGAVFDVAVDLRGGSGTFLKHLAVELTEARQNAIYLPPGLAHGFITLTDHCDVQYSMTDFYRPGLGAGLRWDDPALGIVWPIDVSCISDRDRQYADLDLEMISTLAWDGAHA